MNILKELKRIDLKDLKLFYIKKPLFTKMSYLEETDIFRTEDTDFKVTLDESSEELESYLSKVKVERPKLNEKKLQRILTLKIHLNITLNFIAKHLLSISN